jgi:hypothetical protein
MSSWFGRRDFIRLPEVQIERELFIFLGAVPNGLWLGFLFGMVQTEPQMVG